MSKIQKFLALKQVVHIVTVILWIDSTQPVRFSVHIYLSKSWVPLRKGRVHIWAFLPCFLL